MNGARAWTRSTLATVVRFKATMNIALAPAMHPAKTMPIRPIDRAEPANVPGACHTASRLSTTAATNARPAICVAVSTDSSRCSAPAVDQAIADPAMAS